MQSVSCEVGQSFVLGGTSGDTTVTVLRVETSSVLVGIRTPDGEYREETMSVAESEPSRRVVTVAPLLAVVG